jgi:hydrogenase expression/formation protein HypD
MSGPERDAATAELKFRDPVRARAMADALHRLMREIGRPRVTLMHVCGSHEQAIAKYGLRAILPPSLNVIMGPGCPVCVTDTREVDIGVALAQQGVHIATYGDMLRVPGTVLSLADAQAEGARVHIVYSADQAVELARRLGEPLVFFATGFETTAVATAAILLRGLPPNLSILSAHKYILPAMEAVAVTPGLAVEGFVAAGHAATITGWAAFEPFVQRHGLPVAVAGFEPLDILAALVRLLELVRSRTPEVVNVYPRCVTREGNVRAQAALWEVFEPAPGRWRGIAEIPGGNLVLRERFHAVDALRRFTVDASALSNAPRSALSEACICGQIMTGIASPSDCPIFGGACTPDHPVGACMVSTEGTCRIWHQYGGHPDLGGDA